MHRSGTSMVTRVLRECGVDLGPDTELLQRAHHNQEGHWENARFIELNDELLAALGGSWHRPPALTPGWEHEPVIEDFVRRARALVREFGLEEPWGWKDPRNSLTIRFWKRVWPELRVVVCVRSPSEAARSLAARDGTSVGAALRLWSTYNRSLLEALRPAERVVTLYDSFFADPEGEVRRLAAALGLRPCGDQLARAAAAVNPFIRNHSDRDGPEVTDAGVRECYERLVAEADPPLEASQAEVSAEARLVAANRLLDESRLNNRELWSQLRARSCELERQAAVIESLRRSRDVEGEELEWRRQVDRAREEELEWRRDVDRARERELARNAEEIARLQNMLTELQATRLWRWGSRYWRLKDRAKGLLRR
jgi:hypothetical protein